MKNPIIRTIYLYLFALVGLAMLAIGAVRLVDVGLRAWVFTESDKIYYQERPVLQKEGVPVPQGETVDYAKADRERDMAGAIATILVGLPMYVYHWSIIKRDKQNA